MNQFLPIIAIARNFFYRLLAAEKLSYRLMVLAICIAVSSGGVAQAAMQVQTGETSLYANRSNQATNNNEYQFSSPSVQFSDFTPNALIITWQTTTQTATEDQWSATVHVTTPLGDRDIIAILDEDTTTKTGAATDHEFYSTGVVMLPDAANGFSVDLNTTSHQTVEHVSYTYLDSRLQPTATYQALEGGQQTTTSDTELTTVKRFGVQMVPRKAWLGKSNKAQWSSPGWKPQATRVKSVIIHHTASPIQVSSAADVSDYDYTAMVRAIWYYHTQVLGWGDIGYNFLIAPDGTVYIGRNPKRMYKSATSAIGPVGGHSYNSSKQINYNLHTTAISMIGCYEPDECGNGTTIVTTAANTSLDKLLIGLSRQYHIDPSSRVVQQDITVPAIATHQNFDSTLCAGENVIELLPKLRKLLDTQV